jgi:CheY-like chemotaxis protein
VSATILVVDDEPDVEALFREQLRREIRDGRFNMVFACSGDEALQRIEAFAGTTLVILSDINMPGMSGLNLLPKVKAARPKLAKQPCFRLKFFLPPRGWPTALWSGWTIKAFMMFAAAG